MTSLSEIHRVAIDVDGVVADYTQMYLNAVRIGAGRDIPDDWRPNTWDLDECLGLTDAEKSKAYRLMDAPGMAGLLALFPGAVEGVTKLAEIADVFFVTSSLKSSPTWDFDRRKMLTKHFGKEIAEGLTFTDHKYTFGADLFVDDKPSHCVEWQEAWPDGTALLWVANYSVSSLHDTLPHVQDWDEVYRRVKLLPPTKYKPVNREE